MDAEIWGPKAWFFLHSVSFAYPDRPSNEEKESVIRLFRSLKHLLPCVHCKEHYRQHVTEQDLRLASESRSSLIRWVLDLHNEVNRSLKKKEWTVDMLLQYYKKQYQNDPESKTTLNHPIFHTTETELAENMKHEKNRHICLICVIILCLIGLSFISYFIWKKMTDCGCD